MNSKIISKGILRALAQLRRGLKLPRRSASSSLPNGVCPPCFGMLSTRLRLRQCGSWPLRCRHTSVGSCNLRIEFIVGSQDRPGWVDTNDSTSVGIGIVCMLYTCRCRYFKTLSRSDGIHRVLIRI